MQVFIRRRPHAAEKAGSVGHVVLGTAAVVTPTARRSRRRVMMSVQQQQSADGGCQKYGVVEVLVKGKLQVVRAHGFVDEPPVPVRQRVPYEQHRGQKVQALHLSHEQHQERGGSTAAAAHSGDEGRGVRAV